MTKNLRFKRLLGMLTVLLAASFLFTQVSYSQNTSNDKKPLTFVFEGYPGVIDHVNFEITVDVPFLQGKVGDTDFTLDPFAQAYWDDAAPYDVATGTLMVSGNSYDWSVDPTYMIVEAENHSWNRYEVIITPAPPDGCEELNQLRLEYESSLNNTCLATNHEDITTVYVNPDGSNVLAFDVLFGWDNTTVTADFDLCHPGAELRYNVGGALITDGGALVLGATADPLIWEVDVDVYSEADPHPGGTPTTFTVRVTVLAPSIEDHLLQPPGFFLKASLNAGIVVDEIGVFGPGNIIELSIPYGAAAIGPWASVEEAFVASLSPSFTSVKLSNHYDDDKAGAGVVVCPEVEVFGDYGTFSYDAVRDIWIVELWVYAEDDTEVSTYTIEITMRAASVVGELTALDLEADVSACQSGDPTWTLDPAPLGTTNAVTYQYAADMSAVTFTFDFTDDYAEVEINGAPAVSPAIIDVAAAGFSVTIDVYSQDDIATGGGPTNTYVYNFTQGAASNAKDMFEVGFFTNVGTVTNANNFANGLDVHVYDDAYDVDLKFVVVVPWYVDLYTLEAYWYVSPYACVYVANADGSVGPLQTFNFTPNDHSNSVTYVVRAQNGTEERYDVEVHKDLASDDNTLTGLYFHELEICAVIVSNPLYNAYGTEVSGGYDVMVRHGQVITAVEVVFSVHADAVVTVGGSVVVSGDVHDFSGGPLTFDVTAENGDVESYVVTVVEHPESSTYKYTYKKITKYNIPPSLNAGTGISLDPEVVIDQDAYTIDVWVPWETRLHLTALVATFELNGGPGYPTVPWTVLTRSEDTQYPQTSGVSDNDYTTPIAYTVWDENCESVEYFVTVHVIPDERTGISCFEFGYSPCEPCELENVIDVFAKRIYITVPFSVDITDLAPSSICLFPGATIKPTVGSSSKWDDEQDWTNGPVSYTVTAPDGVTTAVWQVVVEDPACTATTLWDEVHPGSTGETNVTIDSPMGIVALTTAGKEMISIDTDTNTITITYKKGSKIDHVSMYWDLPCNATICCTGAPCVSTYLDFTEGNGCHTCIVTAEDVTVTEEWTICLIEEDYTPPEVWTESVIVWNCDDTAAVWTDEPGTVWIVEESFVPSIMAYQSLGTMDGYEDGLAILKAAKADHLAASAPYSGLVDSLGNPVLVDSLGNMVRVYVSTVGLYSAAYYAFAVDLAGNLSCVSDEKFFIDICEFEVPCLTDVRSATIVEKYNESVYRYNVTGTVVVTYEDCSGKYIKYVQDSCAAIKINDYSNYNHLPTYGIGQGLQNLRGIVSWDLGVQTGKEITLTFIPLDCCPPTKVAGYAITPLELTFEEALHLGTHEYESQLVTITTPMTIEDDYNGYSDWYYYPVVDWPYPYNGIDFLTYTPNDGGYVISAAFECANYMGVAFPSCPSIYTGIRTNFDSGTWGPWAGVSPRNKKDIVKAAPTIVADPNPLVFAGVFVGTCETLSIDIHNFACGEIKLSALYLDNLAGDDTFELMTPLPSNPYTITLGSPLTVDVKWCPVETGVGSTTLIVEYDQVGGVGKILEIPINGSTPITYEMPYAENWNLYGVSKANGGYGYAQYYDDLHDTKTDLGWDNSTCSGTDAVVTNWWGNNIDSYSLMIRARCTVGGLVQPAWVTTPGVVVTGDNPVMSFDEMRVDYSGGPNLIAPRQILISTDGINFLPWKAYTAGDMPEKPNSQKRVYSLAAYGGQTVYFKFISGIHDPTLPYYPINYTYWTLDNFYFGSEITTPILVGSPNPIDAGAGQVGETSVVDVKLTNGGISTALIKDIRLEMVAGPGTPVAFELVDTTYTYPVDLVNGTEAWVLNPETAVNFKVKFTPQTVGDVAANIIVTWGLYDDAEYVIPVTGTGLSCDVAESVGLGVTEFWQNNWYEYTPERFAIVTVLSCWPGNDSESDYDTVLEIYDACGGTRILRNDDYYYGAGLGEPYDYYGVTGDCVNRWASKGTFIAEAGHSYKIFWPHYYAGSLPGPHMMTIVESYPQDGEICQAPIALTIDNRGNYAKNMFGSTADFDDDYSYSSCTPNANYMEGNDVVYTFTIGEDQPNGYLVGDIFGSFAGLHIVDVCPSTDMGLANCIAKAFGSMGGSFRAKIEPGDYFAIASNWAPPQSVDYYFNLSWEDATGVNDVDLLNSVSVYPNPSNGLFNLKVNNPETTDLIIELMDVQGQIIYKNEVKAVMNYNEEIDASTFAKGIYYLRVNNGTDIKVQKVVIQ